MVTWPITQNGRGRDPEYLRLNISETVRDIVLVSMDNLYETTHSGSYGHVTDDVTLHKMW